MAARAQVQPSQQREGDKELRGSLRQLLNRAKHDRHNLVSAHNNGIVQIVEEANELMQQVQRPREQAVDAELFNVVTGAGVEIVSKLNQGGRAYSAGDFLARLKVHHVNDMEAQAVGADDPEAFNWAELGQHPRVTVLFCTVPVVHHMLGPMDAQPRQKRQVHRQAKRRLPEGPAVRPEEVENVGGEEKQETDRNMEEMWRVLAAHGGRVRLLDLIMNQASFPQTIENNFTLSFLVKEGRVALEEDEEDGLIVQQRVPAKHEPKERGAHEKERVQFIFPLDMETWEMLKKTMDPNQPPMMHHRREWRQHAAAAQHEQQQQDEEEEEAEEQQLEQEEEEARPRQQRRRQQSPQDRAEATQQQQMPQTAGEAEEDVEEQEEPPRAAKRRQSRGQVQTQQQRRRRATPEAHAAAKAEPQSQPRRGRRQQQQVQDEQGQAQTQPPALVKTEPQSAPRQRAQQAQQQAEVEVVDLISSDSEIVIPDSTVDNPDAENEGPEGDVVSPPPAKRQAMQPTQGGTQGSGRRMPMRGKR